MVFNEDLGNSPLFNMSPTVVETIEIYQIEVTVKYKTAADAQLSLSVCKTPSIFIESTTIGAQQATQARCDQNGTSYALLNHLASINYAPFNREYERPTTANGPKQTIIAAQIFVRLGFSGHPPLQSSVSRSPGLVNAQIYF